MRIAVIGGTGNMGFGLGLRLAKAGHSILIGSRKEEKARETAERAQELVPSGAFSGIAHEQAIAQAELVVISVPSTGHQSTLEALRGLIGQKPVLDITIPFAFKPLRYDPPAAGSDALETQAILGDGCRVAAGFHTISATLLERLETPLSGDTLIVANDTATKELAMELARDIGLTPYDAGSLVFSSVLESLTPMLIGMNKRYGSSHMGIRITGA